jgi:hypothetical protein
MAGAKYWANGEQNLTTSRITALGLTSNASTANRIWLTEVYFGNEGTPADLAGTYLLERITTVGTASAVTAGKNDLADRAAQSVTAENHTSEPTYVANEICIEVPMNHRGTYRWVAPPGGEPVGAATSADGFGINSLHASATTLFRGGAHWTE